MLFQRVLQMPLESFFLFNFFWKTFFLILRIRSHGQQLVFHGRSTTNVYCNVISQFCGQVNHFFPISSLWQVLVAKLYFFNSYFETNVVLRCNAHFVCYIPIVPNLKWSIRVDEFPFIQNDSDLINHVSNLQKVFLIT